jgi:hypothetical protein
MFVSMSALMDYEDAFVFIGVSAVVALMAPC